MKYLLFISFVFSSFISLGQNLIVNPGAEVHPLVLGWTQVSGFWKNGIEVTPYAGTYHFYAGDNSTDGSELYQDINVSAMAVSIDAGASTFNFGMWVRSYNFTTGAWNDQSKAIVEYRNASGTVLGFYDSGYKNSITWDNYTDSRIAPVGTRSIRVRLISSRLRGTAADGYFDDLSLIHSSTLPVSLISFTSTTLKEAIELNWQTAQEESNDFFTIEKSVDGLNWSTLAIEKGSLNSISILTYKVIDYTPLIGLNYYKLSQTDLNGATTTFQLIVVDFNSTASMELKVYPNPTNGLVYLNGNNEKGISPIWFDYLGKEILVPSFNAGHDWQFDLSRMPSGLYTLEYILDGEKIRKRIQKF